MFSLLPKSKSKYKSSIHFLDFSLCFLDSKLLTKKWGLIVLLFLFRYGSIFKTYILGCPCVMISSPEAAKQVLVTKANLFKPTFPASKERMLGKQAIFFHQGDYHAKLRKLVLQAFKPDSIRNIIPDIESIAITSLESFQGRLINTYQEMKTVCSRISNLQKQSPLFSL